MNGFKKQWALFGCLSLVLFLFQIEPVFAKSKTLEIVQKRGSVICGVSQGLPGFSGPDADDGWTGFDVDFCRAVSTAVFGNPDSVEYIPLSAKERFTALQSGEVDLLARNTTWTYSRDANLGLDFCGVNYYDGQGFMVHKDLGVKSAKELDGASICLNTGTTTELNLADYFRANGMSYEPVLFEKTEETTHAFAAGRCDVLTTDRSGLAAQKTRLKDPENYVILPEVISKEPLGPVVRQGDDLWGDIVRWTLYAMIEAEELGISSQNVKQHKDSKNPAARRLLGLEGELGGMLGLSNDWVYQIVLQVGNYGEVYDRHLGPDTPLGLERGVNDLWTRGGLIYSMPFR